MGFFTPAGQSPSNPFFGAVDKVFDSVVEGFSTGFSETIPSFTADLLGQQQKDQYQQVMFDPENSRKPLGVTPANFEVGSSGTLKIDSQTAIWIAGGILATMLVVRLIK